MTFRTFARKFSHQPSVNIPIYVKLLFQKTKTSIKNVMVTSIVFSKTMSM